jgi:uncharacterized protein YndB with AHSA1/START domain
MDGIDRQSSVTAPEGEGTLVITRAFAAPRALVWRCYTDPVHLVHFWGPGGSTAPLSELDLRVGGRWRQVMRFAGGNEYGYTSAYLEITPPSRLVWRDAPDDYRLGDPLPPATMHTTLDLSEADGRTTVTVTVVFDSAAARDQAVRNGFVRTVTEGNERLALHLETQRSGA